MASLRVLLLLAVPLVACIACSSGDAETEATPGSDPTSSGAPGGAGGPAPGSGGSTPPTTGVGGGELADGGTPTNPQAPSGGGDPVGACDPSCTGSKMCDAANACVCAPGWVASGTDCVAAPVSALATRTKAEVCARYKADTAPVSPLWVAGTANACDPGTIPYASQVAALRYLNFYRWMIGVGPVQVVPSVAKAEQECAKILNYSFSHSPAPSTTCYTAAGAGACADSLIAGGFSIVSQFDGYALETEQNLIHRRNVLAVGRAGVWAGASGGSAAMHYGGAYPALPSDPKYVAHPGPGFVVRNKVPRRWFVQKGTSSIPAVDARVTVAATNEVKPMKRYHHYTDFSSFDVDGWTPAVDVAYKVELVDDANNVVTSFQTTFVDCP